MEYVALLSGGKDSCYNLVHCALNGHQLVAAASLGPGTGKEELDSYLYQTVGQDAIDIAARALDVPLYRRVITGDALDKGSEYGSRDPAQPNICEGDETEDLFELLATVKLAHPDIQAVSVGAILSNYQRVRVEHVCRRLSLIPLCYLWQRDQSQLLSEMIDAGMVSIIIKVAGIGLTTKHLGQTLTEMQPTLAKLHQLYGSHICGEGGEYETLTLDCPLFKQRITLREIETVIHSDNDFATVAYLRIKNATLQPKDVKNSTSASIPPLLEPPFSEVYKIAKESEDLVTQLPYTLPNGSRSEYLPDIGISSQRLGRWLAISNVHSETPTRLGVSIKAEVEDCFRRLKDVLSSYSFNTSHCVNVNVYLSSMGDFAEMNDVYATFFGTSPPARACVAVALPPPLRFQLDCIAYMEEAVHDRQTIHVQGLSYWAPANIGPYSQTIAVDQRVFVSGQIGLKPSSLTLPLPRSLPLESALAFQHVKRLTDVLGSNTGGWKGCTQSSVYWLVDVRDVVHVKTAHQTHEKHAVPTLFLVIAALPKNAVIEKQVLLHSGNCVMPASDDEEASLMVDTPIFTKDECIIESAVLHWEIASFQQSGAFYAIVCGRGQVADTCFMELRQRYQGLWSRSLAARLFYNPSRLCTYSSISTLFRSEDSVPCTNVPCQFISTVEHDDLDFAIGIIGT